MSVLRVVGRLVSGLLTTIVKMVGGMRGAETFGQDSAASLYTHRDDYRP